MLCFGYGFGFVVGVAFSFAFGVGLFVECILLYVCCLIGSPLLVG